MNCLFVVQGEGRGHMTQALALATILRSAGHEVTGVLVGRSSRRDLPAFFVEKIGAPVYSFESPHFVADPANKAIRILPTVMRTVRSARQYRESLSILNTHFNRLRPDLVVNFYEPLLGLYYHRFRPAVPMVCVGHQYMVHHPAFPFPPGLPVDRFALARFTNLTAIGASRLLGLSFAPVESLPEKNLAVMPPLLRAELFEQPHDIREPFFLAYILNAGYAEDIKRWHRANRNVVLHCFWDNRSAPHVYSSHGNLTFHQLNDQKFLSMMARCSGLICTAGFESVCEAMYLGKPVLMVPVESHYEQQCNALDAVAAGAGISSARFDIDRLLAFAPQYHPVEGFRQWVRSARRRFLDELEGIAGNSPAPIFEAFEGAIV